MTELDRYLDDLTDRTLTAADAPPPRLRRRWTGFALVTASTLAFAIAVLIVLSSGGPGKPLDAVAEAREALSPAGQILYMRVRLEYGGIRAGSSAKTVVSTEQWSAENPLRWRSVSHLGNRERLESSYAAGVFSAFDVAADTLVEQQGYRDTSDAARAPGLFGQRGGDPDTDLREMLADGLLVDAGMNTFGGRVVRRLVSRATDRSRSHRSVVYDVDPQTFAPVGGSVSYYGSTGTRPLAVKRFTVERFERLEDSETNAKLLAVVPAPTTKITAVTSTDRQRNAAAIRRWNQTCRERTAEHRQCPPRPSPSATPNHQN